MKTSKTETILIFIANLYLINTSVQKQLQSYQNCEIISPSFDDTDITYCLECESGFSLNGDDNYCYPSQCGDFFYSSAELQTCGPTCSNDQIPDTHTMQCQNQNVCPNFRDVGQSFNKGSISYLILNHYIDDKEQQQTDFMSLSQTDNNVEIWDSTNGQLKTIFIGHTQPIIINAFSQEIQQLVTATQSGEIITWSYLEGRILAKQQWNNKEGEQITEQSVINIYNSSVTMFGYQGEFYLANYYNTTLKSYLAHTKVVHKVLLINSINAISYGYDGQINLWNLNDSNNFKILNTGTYCPRKLDYIFHSVELINLSFNSILSIIYFGNIEEVVSTTELITIIQIEDTWPVWTTKSTPLPTIQNILMGFQIIDFILLTHLQKVIVYSNINISILQLNSSTQTWEVGFQVSLSDLNVTNFIIQKLFFSRSLVMISDVNGYIYTLTFNILDNKNQILPFSEQSNLQFTLQRIGINGIKIDSNSSSLFIYGDQITCFDLITKQIKYIISNFAPSQIRQTNSLNSIFYSVKRQFIATAGDDGLLFLYNYIDGKLLNILTHPNYTIQTTKSAGLQATQVIVVSDKIVCASFSDYTAVCYIPPNGRQQHIFKMKSDILVLRKDDSLYYLLIFTIDNAYIYDLESGLLVSQAESQGSFYQIRFVSDLKWLTSYTTFGSTFVWSYPILSLLYYADNSQYNPTNALLNEQNSVTDNTINFTYYQNGLLIIRFYNLTYYKSIHYTTALNRCGLQYPAFIWCGNQNGSLVGFGIYTDMIIEKQLYKFPILEGKFTSAIDLAFILIDYGSYGSGLQIGNVKNFLADQEFSTTSKIIDYRIDEGIQRIYVAEDSGVAQVFTYIKQTNQIYLNSENSQINKIIPIQTDYQLVILSDHISIKNYFTMEIYCINKEHVQPVQGAVVDNEQNLIISYNHDSTYNLHYWFYNTNESGFLLGHTSPVLQLIVDRLSDAIVSSDSSGVLIVWSYSKLQMTQKINILSNNSPISYLTLTLNAINQILVKSESSICLFNYKTNKIISLIQSDRTSQIVIDDQQSRMFILGNTILVYSYLSGLKITELQGFDDRVQNILLFQNFIVAYARLNIVSFGREGLETLNSGKSSFPIYNGVIIKSVFAFISNSADNSIKLWNYTTGTMLADMVNVYYPDNIKQIFLDESALLIIAINVNNFIFIYDPFTNAINKIIHYLLQGNPPQSDLRNVVIDTQNNLMIVYSITDLVFWNYYIYLGLPGQRMILPNDPQIQYLYNSSLDRIYFFDKEQNVWNFRNNEVKYQKYLSTQVQFVKEKQGAIVIGDFENIILCDENLNEIQRLLIRNVGCYGNNQISYLFIMSDTYNLYQLDTKQQQLNIVQTYIINLESRIVNAKFCIQYSHMFIYDYSGVLVIVDYSQKQVVSRFHDHSAPIRSVKFNVSSKILVTCSDDKNILIYTYSQNSIVLVKTLTQSGFVLKVVLDIPMNRLFFWVHLSQQVQILNINADFNSMSSVLAPGNTFIEIVSEPKYNFLIIFNLFQINFHQYDSLKFLYYLRTPSQLYDITKIQILNTKVLLIITKNSLQLATFTQTSIQIIRVLDMNFAEVIRASLVNRVITLKGINQKTIFNYTMVEDSSSPYTSCIQIVENPNSYFKLQRAYYLLQNSILRSQINIHSIQYIIKIENDSSFYIQNQQLMDANGEYYAQLKYDCIDTLIDDTSKKSKLQIFGSPESYDLSSLVIERCQISLNSNTTYQFNQNTQNFTFSNISYSQFFSNDTQLVFTDIDTFIIDNLDIIDMRFIKSDNISQDKSKLSIQNSLYPNRFFNISTADSVLINRLIIRNGEFKNVMLFSIYDAEKVIIQNLILSNLTITGDSYFYSLFNLKNVQSLIIENIQIDNVQCKDPFSLFSLEGVYYTHFKNSVFRDSKNCSFLSYSKEFQEQKYYKTIKDDYLLIQNIVIQNTTSQNSIISLQSDYFSLFNLTALNNTCENCYGSILNIKNTAYIIDSCTFSQNQGFYGGSLYIQNSKSRFQIQNTIISNNSANSGGGIFLDYSDLILSNCSITNNSAYIGGGVRYLSIIPQFINQKNISQRNQIFNNNATIYGNNLASYPRYITIKNQNSDNYYYVEQIGSQYEVLNFRSGDYLNLLIQLVDEENQTVQISKSLDQYPLQIAQEISAYNVEFISQNFVSITGQSFFSMDQFNFTQSGFLVNQMIVTAEPENTFSINTLSSQIKTPNFQNNTFFNQEYSINILIQFRACQIGEIYIPKNLVQNPFCKPCPKGQYSLQVPSKDGGFMNCVNCPVTQALNCEGKSIDLKNGYWRENNETDVIIECVNNRLNCLAEDENSRFYCKTGHIGPLCEVCDSSGEVWSDIYVSIDQKKTCMTLSQVQSYLFQYVAILIGTIFYIIYGIYKTIQNARRNMYCYYLRMMGIACFGYSESGDIMNVYIKLLMHFYYLSSIIQRNLKVEIPFDFFSQTVSSPLQSFQISQMSLIYIKRSDQREDVYQKQVLFSFIPFLFIALSYIILNFVSCYKKQKLNRNTLINSIVFIFIFFQPDTLASIISMAQCRTIGHKLYLSEDLLQNCYNSIHIRFLLTFSFPMILVWCIIFPGILLYRIRRHKENLFKCKPTFRYGFLYKEYKSDLFYWEFVRMNQRIIIIVINALCYEKTLIINQLTCTVLLIYIVLIMKCHPFKNHIHNRQDQVTHIILMLVYILHTITLSGQDNVIINSFLQLIITSINYTYIIYLFWSIISEKIGNFFYKLVQLYPNFSSIFSEYACCQKFLENAKRQQKHNLIVVFKRWKLLRSLVFRGFLKQSKQQVNDSQLSSPNNNNIQLFSQNSLVQSSNLSFQKNKVLSTTSYPNTINQKDEDFITKLKQSALESSIQQYSNSSVIKLQKIESFQNSIKCSELQTSEVELNVGSHFKQYSSESFASKFLFEKYDRQKQKD